MRARPKLVAAWRETVRDPGYLLTSLAIIVAYVIAAKFGLSLAYATRQITTVWPPSGIAIATLLLLGFRYFPSIYVGALIANALTQEPLLVAAGIAIGNTLEAVIGYWLLRRIFGFKKQFEAPVDLLWFGLAAMACATVAAIWGPIMLAAGRLIHMHNYWSAALTWWQGDLLGIILFAPLILAYADKRARSVISRRWPEAILVVLLIAGISAAVFGGTGHGLTAYPYLLFTLLMWAAIRFTQIGAVTGVVVVAAIAIGCTVSGLGPFAVVVPVEEGLVDLQIYVAMLSATSLVIAMAISTRAAAEQKLREQAEQLKRVELELKDANKRITGILAGVLEKNVSERRHRDPSKRQ